MKTVSDYRLDSCTFLDVLLTALNATKGRHNMLFCCHTTSQYENYFSLITTFIAVLHLQQITHFQVKYMHVNV